VAQNKWRDIYTFVLLFYYVLFTLYFLVIQRIYAITPYPPPHHFDRRLRENNVFGARSTPEKLFGPAERVKKRLRHRSRVLRIPTTIPIYTPCLQFLQYDIVYYALLVLLLLLLVFLARWIPVVRGGQRQLIKNSFTGLHGGTEIIF